MSRKKTFWIGLLCFLSGIWCAQLSGTDFFGTYGYLSLYQLRSFSFSSVDGLDLFLNILWKRVKLFSLITLICMTPVKRVLPVSVNVLCPFLLGFFTMICIMNLGWYGIPFLMLALFPHMICYAAAMLLLYRWEPVYYNTGKRKNTKFFLTLLWIWSLLAAGCASETFLGTELLRQLLKQIL